MAARSRNPAMRARRVLVALCAAALAPIAGTRVGAQDPAQQPDSGAPVASDAQAATSQVETAPIETPSAEDAQRRLLTLFEGTLVDSENGQPFHQSSGYLRLLELVAGSPLDDAKAKATRLDYAASVASPDRWRGDWVTVRGLLADYWGEKLVTTVRDQPNVFRGVITDADTDPKSEEGIVFDMLGGPPPSSFDKGRDPVDVVGVFYRTATYTARRGNTRTVPYLIVRDIRKVDIAAERKQTALPIWAWGMFGLAAAWAAYRVYSAVRGRGARASAAASTTDFDKLFRERARKDRSQSGPRSPS